MKKTSVVILLLHIFSISDAAEHPGKIFTGYRGKRTPASPKDESLNATLPGKPQGDVGVPDIQTQTTTSERSAQTAVSEDDPVGNLATDNQSGIDQLFEVGSSHQDKPGPFRILTSLLDKAAGFVSYLSHPNVGLTPFVLLSKIKRKFYQHLRDKLHQHGDYPFAYKFGNA